MRTCLCVKHTRWVCVFELWSGKNYVHFDPAHSELLNAKFSVAAHSANRINRLPQCASVLFLAVSPFERWILDIHSSILKHNSISRSREGVVSFHVKCCKMFCIRTWTIMDSYKIDLKISRRLTCVSVVCRWHTRKSPAVRPLNGLWITDEIAVHNIAVQIAMVSLQWWASGRPGQLDGRRCEGDVQLFAHTLEQSADGQFALWFQQCARTEWHLSQRILHRNTGARTNFKNSTVVFYTVYAVAPRPQQQRRRRKRGKFSTGWECAFRKGWWLPRNCWQCARAEAIEASWARAEKKPLASFGRVWFTFARSASAQQHQHVCCVHPIIHTTRRRVSNTAARVWRSASHKGDKRGSRGGGGSSGAAGDRGGRSLLDVLAKSRFRSAIICSWKWGVCGRRNDRKRNARVRK